ncbi:hypothetical protein GF406_21380 [candidate division KSB1 bacterium]|nr:hypothetical protein [candidate division KSB1 bacterium]
MHNIYNSKKSLVITGAGFSKAAGLPLDNQIMAEIFSRFSKIEPRAVKYLEKFAQGNLNIVDIRNSSIEEILTKLQVLEYYSRNIHKNDIAEFKLIVLKFLSDLLKIEIANLPAEYGDFMNLFHAKSIFATFNYDYLFETICNNLKINWTYLPDSTTETNSFGSEEYFQNFCFDDFINFEEGDRTPVPYLKLHGSYNWQICWNCKKIRMIPGANAGMSTISKYLIGHRFINCMEPECVKEDSASPLMSPLIIPPTLIKFYNFKYIRSIWTLFQMSLLNIERVIIIGSSLRDEDLLLLNSLSCLNIKNKSIKELIFINPNIELKSKIADLSDMKISHYSHLKNYLAQKK